MKVWNPFRRQPADNPGADRGAPFVMSLEGEIYSDPTGRATDLELAGGAKEVLGAGRWVVVVAQGHVLVVTNESSTYRPSPAQMRMVVTRLAEMGADLGGDGKGLLVIVYAEFDENGRGTHGKRYRATRTAIGVDLIPEE